MMAIRRRIRYPATPGSSNKKWLAAALIIGSCLAAMIAAEAKDKKMPTTDNGKAASANGQAGGAVPKRMSASIQATNADIPEGDIYFGKLQGGATIIDPRCFDPRELLATYPETAEADKAKKSGSPGKHWILRSRASDKMVKDITDLAEKTGINFLCTRQRLFPVLRRQDEFKAMTDRQLIAGFDITGELIEFSASRTKKTEIKDNKFEYDY